MSSASIGIFGPLGNGYTGLYTHREGGYLTVKSAHVQVTFHDLTNLELTLEVFCPTVLGVEVLEKIEAYLTILKRGDQSGAIAALLEMQNSFNDMCNQHRAELHPAKEAPEELDHSEDPPEE